MPAIGASFTPEKLGDNGIQQVQEKMLQWEDSVKDREQQGDETNSTLAMEVKMSSAKSHEISRLKTDLEQAVEENEKKKKALEEMEEMFLKKKDEVLVLNTLLESKDSEIYELRSIALGESNELEHSIQERDLRIATLESKLRAKEAKLNSAINPNKKQCADAAIQADYLAMAEFGLKGVEICGEKVFEVTAGSSEKYKWDSHGFQLIVPNGALPPGVTASVAVRSIVAGPFKLPTNSKLISAIYWISSTHVFLKKVTVQLQHCAIINTEEECSHFKIIIGKCSQDPPYQFAVKDGVFASNSNIASMSVTQFSIIAATGFNNPQIGYMSLVFHKRLSHTLWEIAVVTVKALSTLEESVQRKYPDFTCSRKFKIIFEKELEGISVQICPDEEALWDISFLDTRNTSILKGEVDSFSVDEPIPPSCGFLVEWRSEAQTVKDLRALVILTQKDCCPREIKLIVTISPQLTQERSQGIPSQRQGTHCTQQDFMEDVAAKTPASWYLFGIFLGIKHGQLRAIEEAHSNQKLRCFSEVYYIWESEKLEPLTWEVVVRILATDTLAEKGLSNDLARKYSVQV